MLGCGDEIGLGEGCNGSEPEAPTGVAHQVRLETRRPSAVGFTSHVTTVGCRSGLDGESVDVPPRAQLGKIRPLFPLAPTDASRRRGAVRVKGRPEAGRVRRGAPLTRAGPGRHPSSSVGARGEATSRRVAACRAGALTGRVQQLVRGPLDGDELVCFRWRFAVSAPSRGRPPVSGAARASRPSPRRARPAREGRA
jgi:hypothetical protein